MTVVPLDAHRNDRIGGSEAAAACGVDPFRSRVMLYAEKVGMVERDESEAMRWGTLLEPVIAQELERRGYEVMPAAPAGYVDDNRPWMHGHPDGFTHIEGTSAILEIKTTSAWSPRQWDEQGGTPFANVMQLHHYFELTGYSVGLLAVLVGGQRLETRVVQRDDAVIARMLELEGEFIDYLRRREPPPPDGSHSASDALSALFPSGGGGVVRLDNAHWQTYRGLVALREQEAAIATQRAEKEQTLKAFMGEASEAISPHDVTCARWTTYERTDLDRTALKAARPDVYQEFSTTKTLRRFTLE